jgi:hypothetical protein
MRKSPLSATVPWLARPIPICSWTPPTTRPESTGGWFPGRHHRHRCHRPMAAGRSSALRGDSEDGAFWTVFLRSPVGPRPGRHPIGHLRCPRRLGARHQRRPARRGLEEMSRALKPSRNRALLCDLGLVGRYEPRRIRALPPRCGHLECRMMEIRRQGVPRGDEVVSAGVQGGRRRVVPV